jgi:hypothetical protein
VASLLVNGGFYRINLRDAMALSNNQKVGYWTLSNLWLILNSNCGNSAIHVAMVMTMHLDNRAFMNKLTVKFAAFTFRNPWCSNRTALTRKSSSMTVDPSKNMLIAAGRSIDYSEEHEGDRYVSVSVVLGRGGRDSP